MSDRPYSIATLAERWSCSQEKVRQMIRSGQLGAFRNGKMFRIPQAEVDRIEGVAVPAEPDLVGEQPAAARSRAEPPAPMTARPMPSRWPQMMKRVTAAAYCDLSEGAFCGEVLRGRLPAPVKLGERNHWHKPALDAALAYLAGDDCASRAEQEFWDRGAPYQAKVP